MLVIKKTGCAGKVMITVNLFLSYPSHPRGQFGIFLIFC